MKQIIQLEGDDFMRVEFKTRFISTRQYLGMTLDELAEEGCYTPESRVDMWWIECILDENHLGFLSIEPSLAQGPTFFSIPQTSSYCWCKLQDVDSLSVARRARLWFEKQSAYLQQCKWCQDIEARCFRQFGGYGGYLQYSRERANAWKEKKIAAASLLHEDIQRYKQLLAEGQDGVNEVRNHLNKRFKELGVYRVNDFTHATLSHLLWIYNSYVAQPATEQKVENLS